MARKRRISPEDEKENDRIAENFKLNSPKSVTQDKNRKSALNSWDRYFKQQEHIKNNVKVREYAFKKIGVPTENYQKVSFKNRGHEQSRTRDIFTGRFVKG